MIKPKHFHKYTTNSVKKTTILTVLLASIIIYQSYKTKTDLQKLSEGQIIQIPKVHFLEL
ncbi:MAG: hypothetical protein E7Z86_07845 [Methanosphaera stadtmanae]|jgi:hypothetical protein|nr:hypothetical protein [Methanosphaera stadtmanae]